MLVTHNKTTQSKHISREQVQEVLADTVWTSGFSYTLNATLIAPVIKK